MPINSTRNNNEATTKSMRISHIVSTTQRISSSTKRLIHHRYSPAFTTTKRKRLVNTNSHTLPSNRIAAFALTTIMMSSNMPSSSMAEAFIPSPKASIVKMDTALTQHPVSVEDENKILFTKIKLEKFDNVLDMSSSVGTTVGTSTASSSYTSPEQYQYSLRKVLVSDIRLRKLEWPG